MIPFLLHDFPKPGATDYCAKHQALPLLGRCCSMTSWFHLVDFQCCGKGLRTDNDGKTISNLRLYNAICINNIDFRSTTNHLKPRSRVEVSFWTFQVILISIEANNNLQICQKENFILILNHLSLSLSKFFNFMCKCVLTRQSQRKFGNPSRSWHEWPAGADVEVPNADPEAISPLCLAEGQRHETIDVDCYVEVPLESQTTNPNHQWTISWDIFVDISWSLLFWVNLRSCVAWVAAHWRSKGHQRVGYPHSCP